MTKIEFGTLPMSYTIEQYSAPTVCLLCHRVLQHVPIMDQREDYSVVETPREGFEDLNDQTNRIRGHLIAHFPMFGRPPANERRGLLLRAPTNGRAPRRIAGRWIDQLEKITVATANMQRNRVRPLLQNRELSEVEVRKFYRELITHPELSARGL